MKFSINEYQKKTEYSNPKKILALFSWMTFLVFANYQNYLIEAFLFSVALTFIAYYLFNGGGKESVKITKVIRTGKYSTKQNRDGYLNVFFAS